MRKSTFINTAKAICLISLSILLILPAHADAPNLVSNGNFNQIKDGQAAGWNFSTAKPEIFKLSFPQEKDQGNVAQMDVSSAVMSGYLGQIITVKPHTDYHFSALAKLDKGKALIYIHGGPGTAKVDTRIYVQVIKDDPLVPWFWEKKWVGGGTYLAESGKWEPVSIDFNSGELTSVTVSLGAYFEAGQYQFDDVSVTEIPVNK